MERDNLWANDLSANDRGDKMKTTDSLPNSPIWDLRRFDRARRQAAAEMMRDLPLQDPAQHVLMMCIHRVCQSGALPSQRELAKMTQRSPATVTASLQVLERQGLIRRTPDETDQRINRVELTGDGEDLARECCRRIEALDVRMIDGLSPEEQEILSRLFGKMTRNLAAYTGDDKEGDAID